MKTQWFKQSNANIAERFPCVERRIESLLGIRHLEHLVSRHLDAFAFPAPMTSSKCEDPRRIHHFLRQLHRPPFIDDFPALPPHLQAPGLFAPLV